MSKQAVTALCGIGTAIKWDRLPNLQAIIDAANSGELGESLTEWLSSFGWEPPYHETELSRPPERFNAQKCFDTGGPSGRPVAIVDNFFRQNFLIPDYHYELPQQITKVRSELKRNDLWQGYYGTVKRLGDVPNVVCNIYQLYQLLQDTRKTQGDIHPIGFRKNEHSVIFLLDPLFSKLYVVDVRWKRDRVNHDKWAWHLNCMWVNEVSAVAGTAMAGIRIFHNYSVVA